MEHMNEIVREAEEHMPKAFSDALNGLAQERDESLFKVPVLGGMKAGKSTLLSRLLECDQAFLPPGVLEATARCVRIGYGFAAVRRIVRVDGSEAMVETDEEWDALVRGKASLSDGDSLAIDLPSDILRQGNLVLFDTPGNNTTDGAKETETWSALSGSQLAVYCLRATEILTKTDLQFLQTASYKLKNFVFVVSRLDEAGIRDVTSPEAQSLLDYVSERLSETFGVQPLAVVAVSAKLDGSVSGIPALKDLLRKLLAENGERLRLQRFSAEVRTLTQGEMSRIDNALGLLKRGFSESEDVALAQIGAFKAQLVENEEERTRAIKRLATDLEGKRLSLRQDISAAAEDALERLKRRLDDVKSSSDLEDSGTGLILSEVDRWQEDVREKVFGFSQSGDELMVGAADEFLNRLNASARDAVGGVFKITLADADQYEVSASQRDELKRLVAGGKDMESEIAELEANLGSEADQIPELRAGLDAVRTEMGRLEYVPQYVEKRFGTVDGGMEDALSKVGQIVDFALMLAPIPGTKLRWLTKLKYGKKIKKVIDGANKLIRAKNKFISLFAVL